MQIQSITKEPNFEGKLVVKNAISNQQNYLFNLHKPVLEKMIKDMPFDLFVEQSKSKRTISLFTNVEGASAYVVRKNQQNFEEAAVFVIEDAKKKSEAYQKIIKANEILQYKTQIMQNILFGNYKAARELEKQLAKVGVENFGIYKEIPNLKLNNIPWAVVPYVLKNSFKYRIYKAFSSKIPEEKVFLKMKKDYLKELKSQNKKIKTLEINLPNMY